MKTIELIMSAWRPSTVKLYKGYLQKWGKFCVKNKVKILSPTLPKVCDFLTGLAEEGVGFSVMNFGHFPRDRMVPSREAPSGLLACSGRLPEESTQTQIHFILGCIQSIYTHERVGQKWESFAENPFIEAGYASPFSHFSKGSDHS